MRLTPSTTITKSSYLSRIVLMCMHACKCTLLPRIPCSSTSMTCGNVCTTKNLFQVQWYLQQCVSIGLRNYPCWTCNVILVVTIASWEGEHLNVYPSIPSSTNSDLYVSYPKDAQFLFKQNKTNKSLIISHFISSQRHCALISSKDFCKALACSYGWKAGL